MKEMLRIGAVGTSAVMDTMQEAIRMTDGLECSVICSRSAERGEAYAAKNGIAAVCTDLDELVKRDDVDIVYIATPNTCHVSQAEKALANGKHVFLEKPLALGRGEVDHLYAAAGAGGAFLFEAITTLFMPEYLACRSLLPSIGAIKKAELKYGQYSSKLDMYKKGIISSSLDPAMKGGALNDMGIYCIHTAIDLFGVPAGVSYSPELGPNGIDLEGDLTMDYGTFICQVKASKKQDIGSGCLVEGENGSFIQTGPVNAFGDCKAQIGGDEFKIGLQGDENRMIYELARFRDAIRSGDKAFHYRMYHQSRAAAGVLEDAHAQ